MRPQNNPTVWNKVWRDPQLNKEDVLILKKESNSRRWEIIRKVLIQEYQELRGLKVIELGSGLGTYSALMAKSDADVTLVDYSTTALKRAREFYSHNKLKAKFINCDILDITKKHDLKPFDVSISVGLLEHFQNEKRIQAFLSHLQVLKRGGLAIMLVPNKINPPYRIYKFIAEKLGTWKYGVEEPFSPSELHNLCKECKYPEIGLYGDSLYNSLKFLIPANFLRRLLRVDANISTPLDNILSYCLIFIVRNPQNLDDFT